MQIPAASSGTIASGRYKTCHSRPRVCSLSRFAVALRSRTSHRRNVVLCFTLEASSVVIRTRNSLRNSPDSQQASGLASEEQAVLHLDCLTRSTPRPESQTAVPPTGLRRPAKQLRPTKVNLTLTQFAERRRTMTEKSHSSSQSHTATPQAPRAARPDGPIDQTTLNHQQHKKDWPYTGGIPALGEDLVWVVCRVVICHPRGPDMFVVTANLTQNTLHCSQSKNRSCGGARLRRRSATL